MTDIFDFWSKVSPAAHVHPTDEEVFGRVKHHFDLTCLPSAYTGPLKTAKVVMLFLAPGLADEGFDTIHAASEHGRDWYARQRHGTEPLPSEDDHRPHHRWWTSKVRQFGVPPELAAQHFALLDMAAYHSKSFRDWHMLTALPSSRVTLDWAQSVLFPQAIAGERIVICLRSPNSWGLSPGSTYGKGLFAPTCTRGGFMHTNELRIRVIGSVQDALS